MKSAWAVACATGLSIALSANCAHAQIKGAGSTLAADLYTSWANSAGRWTELRLQYVASGSGNGIKSVLAGRTDFAAVELPMSRAALDKSKLVQFPSAIAGVAVVANVPGVPSDKLRLSPDVLAGIYSGRIKRWNHPAIRSINPEVSLPALAIVPAYRNGASGTSLAFSTYLSKVSSDLAATSTFTVRHGKGVRSGADAVSFVKAQAGAIGYVDYASAANQKVATVQLKNQAGHYVGTSNESIAAAAGTVDWDQLPLSASAHYQIDLTDTACAKCWPIATVTYVIVPMGPRHAGHSERAMQFFDQAIQRGDEIATSRHYVPLPSRAKKTVQLAMRHWSASLASPPAPRATQQRQAADATKRVANL